MDTAKQDVAAIVRVSAGWAAEEVTADYADTIEAAQWNPATGALSAVHVGVSLPDDLGGVRDHFAFAWLAWIKCT
ncbi:hypothetical protein [Sphingomonas rubra]|nr:hypothetical protein [Sphingomonas rubra]